MIHFVSTSIYPWVISNSRKKVASSPLADSDELSVLVPLYLFRIQVSASATWVPSAPPRKKMKYDRIPVLSRKCSFEWENHIACCCPGGFPLAVPELGVDNGVRVEPLQAGEHLKHSVAVGIFPLYRNQVVLRRDYTSGTGIDKIARRVGNGHQALSELDLQPPKIEQLVEPGHE